MPEVHRVVAGGHEPFADLHVAGLDGLHTDESTLLEFENLGTIRGRGFREDAKLIPSHGIVFSLSLSLGDCAKRSVLVFDIVTVDVDTL